MRSWHRLSYPGVFALVLIAGSAALVSAGVLVPSSGPPALTSASGAGAAAAATVAVSSTSVTGIVRDGATDLPLAGAMISGGGTITLSDATGAYTLALPAGTTWLTAVAPTYGGPGQAVTLAAGEQRQGVDFFLYPLNATISGVVRDSSTGLPLEGVSVDANVNFWSGHATSDAAGAFTITVYAGRWYVNATKAGYAGAAGTVTVYAGAHAEGIDLALNPVTAWIRGILRRGDGSLIPYTGVWANRYGGVGGSTGTSTDGAGEYVLGVTAGRYSVQFGPDTGTMSSTPFVTLADGETVVGVDLSLLTNTVTISGRIVDYLGNPVAGAHVEPRDPGSGHWLSWGVDSSASGYYTLPLPAGTWQIATTRDGYVNPTNQTISVSDGSPLGGVDFTLRALDATIRGTVRDSSTNAVIAGATVNTGHPQWGTGTTADSSGNYTLTVYAGNWNVNAFKPGYLQATRAAVVGEGEHLTGFDLSLTPANSLITGTVRYDGEGSAPDGAGVPNVWVGACNRNGWCSGGNTDPSGRYSVSVTAGIWTLFSSMNRYTLRETRQIVIGDYQTMGGVDLVYLENDAAVVGHVRDQNGNAVPGASVGAEDARIYYPVTPDVVADASGAYTLPIASGTWRMIADAQGYVRADQVVTVTQGVTLTADLEMWSINATIRGTVHGNNGAPVEGVRVDTGIPGWGSSATSDASGAYTLPVFGGNWWLWYSKSGYKSGGQWVAVADNEHRTGVDFTLTALNATIEGTVREAGTGVPIPGASVSTGTYNWGTNTTADSSGNYTLTVYAGTWNVNASKAGYVQGFQSATVGDGEHRTGVDVSLTPAHSLITGTARYTTGVTIPNSWVGACGNLCNNTRTDSSGVYSMSVTPGTWTLNGSRSGYTLRETPRVTIGDYQTIGGIDLVYLENDAAVVGRVRDTTGAPIAAVRVQAQDSATGSTVSNDAFADSSGVYTLPVAAGTWRIYASTAGYVSAGQVVALSHGQTATLDLSLPALNATIEGTVREAGTGVPIPGASVSTGTYNWGTNTTADSSGNYTLTVYAGTWNVNASKAGYVQGFQSATVGDGEHRTGVDVSLTPAHSLITGTARYTTGVTIPNSWVGACGNLCNNTRTDASGVYSMSVTPGTWTLYGSRSGYTLRETPRVTIGDYQTMGGIDLVYLENDAAMVGHVRDTIGTPIPGARVRANDQANGYSVTFDVIADASGAYTLPIAAGVWQAYAQAGGYVSANQVVTATQGQTLTVDFSLRALNATIRGIVRDDGGVAIPGAQVWTGVPGWGANATTDAAGSYTITVYAGTWSLSASKSGYKSASIAVTVVDNEHRVGADVMLYAINAMIKGTVREAGTGLAIPGAKVDTGAYNWGTSATTDPSGNYTLTVYAGTWSVGALMAGYLQASRSATVGYGEQLAGIDLSLTPAHSLVTGTLRYATGGTVANAWVNAKDQSGAYNRTQADASGVYSVSVTPGTWTLNGSRSGYTLQQAKRVTIGDYQTMGDVDLVYLANDAAMIGHVRDTIGTPIPGARVRANDQTNGYSVTSNVVADASGVYTLPIAAGVWQAYAEAGGYVSANQVVTATLGQTLTVDFSLLALNAIIRGIVRDDGGVPIPGVKVSTGAPGWGASATTDAAGSYTITVYAGTWSLSASKSGYKSASIAVTVADNELRTGADVMLYAINATIKGTVRDASTNAPIGGAVASVGVPGFSASAATDPSGNYTLTVYAGTWNVSALMAGYLQGSRSATVGYGEQLTGVDLSLTPAHSLVTGTLRYATGGTVANAWVSARDQSGASNRTQADASGVYSMSVTPGTWTINGSRSGYTLQQAKRLAIGDYQTIGDVDLIYLANDAAMVGHVRDTIGTPIPGARVRANDQANGYSVTFGVIADASGAYTLPIAAGVWQAYAEAGGYASVSQVVTTTQGQTLTVDFSLRALNATIHGTVRDGSGSPVSGATVNTDVYSGWRTSTTTDATGVYTLSVYAGTWGVSAWKTGYVGAGTTVTVADSERRTGVDFNLILLNATIQGTVREAGSAPMAPDAPIEGAKVETERRGWGTSTKTDAGGAYTLTVYAGDWTVSAAKHGYLMASRTVSVTDGGHFAGADLSLTPAYSIITGTLRLSNTGGILPNQTVNAIELTTGIKNRTWTDASGTYTMSVTPGTWAPSSTVNGYTLRVTPRVTIGDYETIGGIDLIYVPNDATITGHLVDSRGRPVATSVWAEDPTTGVPVVPSVRPNATGAYTLPIAGGLWQVAAGGGGPQGLYVRASQYVSVSPGQTLSGVDFTLFEVVRPGFTATPLSGPAPLVVTFADLSTGDYTALLWSFGDGATSTITNPIHAYMTPGVYTVTLAASGPGGSDVLTRTSYVSVTPGTGSVDLALVPGTATVGVGQIFTAAIEVRAGTQMVDALAAYVDFDPTVLQIVGVDGNPATTIENPGTPLNVELQNEVDTARGRVDYAVGKLCQACPTGTFVAGVLRFRVLREVPAADVAFAFDQLANRLTSITYGGNGVLRSATGGHFVVTNGILLGSLTLLGREVVSPADPYSVPLRVQLFAGSDPTPVISTTVATDRNAQFTVAGISPGTYTITVKNAHTLGSTKRNVALSGGTNNVNMCTLYEGDVNNNNQVNITDFSLLATAFGSQRVDPPPSRWNPGADFNESGQINIRDFSLLASSYGKFNNQSCT